MIIVACIFSFFISLVSLLGLWMGLSRGTIARRACIFLVGTAILGVLLCLGIGEWEAEWLLLVAMLAGMNALIAGGLKLRGLRIAHTSEVRDEAAVELQFSLFQLMTVTTIIAVFLATGRALGNGMTTDLLFAFACALTFAFVATCLLWSVLSTYAVHTRIASGCFVVTFAACVAYYVMEVAAIDPGEIWFTIVILFGSILAGALMLVRMRGYRLVRYRAIASETS
ncbi:MAG: hypothetical protein HKN47_27015 [Pirellulaceae bacterium]|nr:hypothetical protein [Pirellulaceae bacterium]